MMESDFLSPNTYHAPSIENDNTDRNSIEHRFCAEIPAILNTHEAKDANALSHQPDYQELSQLDGVIMLYLILKS